MRIITLNVFSSDNGGGNPCALIEDASILNDKQMQEIATKINYPETVFINKVNDDYILRFFATKGELPLCCHGAMGAAYSLFMTNKDIKPNIKTFCNNTKITIDYFEDQIFMSVACGKILKYFDDIPLITQLLDTKHEHIDKSLVCAIASIGSPKLFIPITTKDILLNISPNLDLIDKWCKENSINGLYIYSKDTFDPKSSYIARNFNPLFSHKEDIATGVAAAGLSQMIAIANNSLGKYIIEQGYNLGSPSKIYVNVTENHIEIRGNVFFTENDLSLENISSSSMPPLS